MKARITEIIDEAQDIKSFRLEPEHELTYIPGQWMYVQIKEGLKHHFTISSSPTENFLQFTTKFRPESEYKKALWQLKVGDTLEINGAHGGFILDEKDPTPRLFITGGIGITPFRSMIKYATDKGLSVPISLLYSVKTKAEAAFADLPNCQIIETESQGRLDEAKVKQLCPDWKDRSWWLCGPPAMVEALMNLGQKMGMSAEQLKSEEFTGY